MPPSSQGGENARRRRQLVAVGGGGVSAPARLFLWIQNYSPLITAAPSQVNAGAEEGRGAIVAMSCADGQVRVPADDINFLSKINSPLLTAVPSQVDARDAGGCGRGDGIMSGEYCDRDWAAKGETRTLTRDYFLY